MENQIFTLNNQQRTEIATEILNKMKKYYPIQNMNLYSLLSEIEKKYKIQTFELTPILYSIKRNGYVDFTNGLAGLGGGSGGGTKEGFHYHRLEELEIGGHLTKEGYDYLINEDNLALTKQLANSTLDANKNQLKYAIISGAAIILTTLFAGLSWHTSKKSLELSEKSLQKSEQHEHLHDSICQILNNGQYIIIDTSNLIKHKLNTHK